MQEWLRQPGESGKAYEAFCVYRDLGAGRSVQKVVEKLSKSRALISRWSTRYKWQERADAWDNSITEEARQKVTDELTAMWRRQIETGYLLQVKASEAVQKTDWQKMPFSSLLKSLKLGAEIERSARQMLMGSMNKDAESKTDDVIIYLPAKEAVV